MSTNTATKPQEFSADVRGQYEDYPYPFVDPEKEGASFNWCDAESLLGLSHAGWGGKRDLRKNVRMLVAGCGTGDSTILFAEELLGTDSEIVAIDISAKSIEIAKARMKKRKLDNATFHHMSILDLPNAGLGEFDVIESGGVLHHLPDPNAGLAALASVLKPEGLMAIMVYGQYGRLSIYLVQELMKRLMNEATPRAKKIEIAREYLNNVPNGHWLTVNNAHIIPELQWPDGSGIYDLFLHSTDRAYTVPQLYEWVESCGLVLNQFFGELTDDSLYTPECYNGAPNLKEIFATKTPRERQAIAELMNGNIGKHYFYASKQPKIPAQFADDMVICYGQMQSLFLEFVEGFVAGLEKMPIGQRIQGKARAFANAPELFLTKNKHTIALMRAIDGKRSIGQIINEVAAASVSSHAEVRRDLETLYKEYRARQIAFLRHESIPSYFTGQEIIARAKKAIQGQ